MMAGCMIVDDGWGTDELIDRWMDGCVNAWMDRQTKGWMNTDASCTDGT